MFKTYKWVLKTYNLVVNCYLNFYKYKNVFKTNVVKTRFTTFSYNFVNCH